MIKNVLYSLFLHSILLAIIYVNFKNLVNDDIDILKEGIAVSIAGFESKKTEMAKENASKAAQQDNKTAEKPKVKAENKPEKKPKPAKKEIKTEVKEPKKSQTKKVAEKKSAMPTTSLKHNEFKQEEPAQDLKKIVEEEKIQEEKIEPKSEIAKNEEEVEEEIANANPQENVVNDLENLNLSAREKYTINSQLRGCYHRALQDNYDNDLSITITVNVAVDGTINFDAEKIIDMVRYNNPREKNYRQLMDGVISALEFCSPLRNMPADKYEIWKEFTIQFGGK